MFPSKLLLATALGHLGFVIMRLTLLAYFRNDLIWFVAWEEATELMLVATIAFVVWAFRSHGFEKAVAGLAARGA